MIPLIVAPVSHPVVLLLPAYVDPGLGFLMLEAVLGGLLGLVYHLRRRVGAVLHRLRAAWRCA